MNQEALSRLAAAVLGQHPAPDIRGGDDDWRTDALCAQIDPDLWHPEKGGSARPAKAVCLTCPVILSCREWAISHGQRDGIWGGLSDRERRVIERQRREQAA